MEIERDFCVGGYYHIYNRGNYGQSIFLDDIDYIGYLERLRDGKEKNNITVICYCLMPDHTHLLLRQDSDVPISKLIQSVHTSYSMYYNRKYKKTGHLFQGRFKQKYIDNDEYLLQVSSYIHLSPLISNLVDRIEDYSWSSYPDYIGLRKGTLCNKKPVMLKLTADEYKKITEEEIKEKLIIKEFQEKLTSFKQKGSASKDRP